MTEPVKNASPGPGRCCHDDETSRPAWLGPVVLAVAGVATVVVCVLAIGRWLPLGVPGEWSWDYHDSSWHWADVVLCGLFGAALIGVVALGWHVLGGRRRWPVPLLLVALLVTGTATQVAIERTTPVALGTWVFTTHSPSVSGYWSFAAAHPDPAAQFLRDYNRHLAGFRGSIHAHGHLGTHPPGLFLAHKLVLDLCRTHPPLVDTTLRLTPAEIKVALDEIGSVTTAGRLPLPRHEQAAIVLSAVATRLVSLLTVIPLYWLGSRVAGRRVGWLAAGLYLVCPAPILFAPKGDTAFPFLATWIVLAAHGAVGRRGWPLAFLAGTLAFLGLFLSLAFVVVVVLAGLVGLAAWWRLLRSGRSDWNRLAARAGLAAVGLCWPIVWLKLHFNCDMLDIWVTNVANHALFYEHFPRTYWTWVWVNPVEFLLATGIPTACLLAAAVGLRAAGGFRGGRGDVVLWPLLVVLVALDVSGKNASEVARLWIFLMPFLCLAGAQCAERFRARPLLVVTLLVVLGLVQAVVFVGTIDGLLSKVGA